MITSRIQINELDPDEILGKIPDKIWDQILDDDLNDLVGSTP
jgi:hypothetical protein